MREIRALPQTFLYFVAYFLLADGLNTTGMFPAVVRNSVLIYFRNSGLDHPERLRLVFLLANHIPRYYSGCVFYHFNIWILVYPAILQAQNEDHVHDHQFL